MDVKQVISLANLFRDSGDKILNSEVKLTLTGTLLKGLNDSFSLIANEADNESSNSFQVVKPLNSKSEVLEDLQLIYDFVQKTLSLCITNFPGDEFYDIVDLNKFRSLIKLEIQKLDVMQISGIQKLRAQLKHLICNRCLKNVDDIIVYCGRDNSMGFVWNALRVADFSYNNLKKCDNSLEFAAYLQNLNLSHNHLTSVEAVKWLPHLEILNLSCNRLTSIPNFHIDANRKLRKLILNNNMIDTIGAYKLECLTDLDLSNNSLLDHSNLLPLSTFRSLVNLNLSGNPLSCHPKYRENTVKYLHLNASREKFSLDFQPLTKYEKSLTGKIKSFLPLYTTRSYSQINRISGSMTSIRGSLNRIGDTSSIGSVESFKSDFGSAIKKSELNKRISKNRIIDPDSSPSLNQLEEDKKHLETKKQIEKLRMEYGPQWLQNETSKEVVESVLGLDKQKRNDENMEKYKINPDDLINDMLTSFNNTNILSNSENTLKNLTSTPINTHSFLNTENGENGSPIFMKNFKEISYDNKSNTDTVYHSLNEAIKITETEENNTTFESARENENISIVENLYSNCGIIEEEQNSELEDNDECYVAYINEGADEILLTVSDTKIRERNAKNQRTLKKWSLKMLESCERTKSNTIVIHFDTINIDKKVRVYKIEEKRCQHLEKLLRDILSNRQLSEMNQTIYRCVQCLCQFSREKPKEYMELNNFVQCPECQSKFVAEVNESSIVLKNDNVKTINPPLNNNTTKECIKKNFTDNIAFKLFTKQENSMKSFVEEQSDSINVQTQENSLQKMEADLKNEKQEEKEQLIIKEDEIQNSVPNNENQDIKKSLEESASQCSIGLFQSKSQKSLNCDEEPKETEKYKYNYTDFGEIDHRLKFYFIMNKFNNQNEYFKCIIKTKIFEGNNLHFYEGIIVISTNKLYIMEIIATENEDPSKWLKEILSVSIDRVESLQILPFKAGLSLSIRNHPNKFLLILQDILRTDSLMLFFANNPLPDNCSLEYQVSEIVTTKLMSVTNNKKITMFSILSSCEINAEIENSNSDNQCFKQTIVPSAIYTTDDHLYLTKSNLSWLSETLDINIEFISIQKMCNLVEVKKYEDTILEIYFTDERINSHYVWKCEFGTHDNAETFLIAIRTSWEKIFGVPLINDEELNS